jgi:hypothetical protein
LTTTDPAINPVVGKVYRLYTVAVNKFGESLPSKKVIIGFGAKPPAPTNPVRDSSLLKATSM